MKSFEIVNTTSGYTLGIWEAESAEDALDMYASDAGYESFEDACKVASGDDIEAREVESRIDAIKADVRKWAAEDKAHGRKISHDGALPEDTADMIGRAVDELGMNVEAADKVRVEMMELWVTE